MAYQRFPGSEFLTRFVRFVLGQQHFNEQWSKPQTAYVRFSRFDERFRLAANKLGFSERSFILSGLRAAEVNFGQTAKRFEVCVEQADRSGTGEIDSCDLQGLVVVTEFSEGNRET